MMRNSSAVTLLRTLTPDEIRDFKNFLSSPFFNKNDNVIRLFNYLKKFYPEFAKEHVEKELIHKKIFGGGKYNDGFMRTVIFNLNSLLEEYLSYRNYRKNEIGRKIGLLRELNERKAEKVFMKIFRETEQLNEALPFRDSMYFLNRFNLTHEREYHNLWNKSEYKSDLREKFRNAYKDLTFFYLTTVLKEYRYLIYLRGFSPDENSYEFLSYILSYLSADENEFTVNPYISLHLNEIILQQDKSEKHFHILKKLLRENVTSLSTPDRFSLQNILQIFCIGKIFEGDERYLQERQDLFNIILDQKLFSAIDGDFFEATLFANMINFGLAKKDLKWVEELISTYSDRIDPLHRETLINYSLAKLDFERKDFIKALEHVNKIGNVRHPMLKIPVRITMLQILYELGMMEQIFYQLDSLRHYLTNNTGLLSPERLERSMNFHKYMNKLSKLKERKNEKGMKELHKQILKETNTNERKWLIEKSMSH